MPPMLSDSAVFESKLCEDTMSKDFGIALAGLRQRYDPLSDHLAHDLWTATSVLERVCNDLICQAELRYRFWIESGVTKQTNDFSALRHPNRWSATFARRLKHPLKLAACLALKYVVSALVRRDRWQL